MDTATAEDLALLPHLVNVAQEAGRRVREIYSPAARPASRDDLYAGNQRVEEAGADGVRKALTALRPEARWLDDDPETHRTRRQLAGEWWVVDGVEGAVNFLHGLPEWSVNLTLVRDNLPVAAVVYQPVGERTFTAVRGGGARLNGTPLRASAKVDLSAAIVTTSQAGGSAELNRRTAGTIETMFGRALLVRQTVPSTFPLLDVAAGHFDVYWRFGPDLPALAPGVLLATEAGAVATEPGGQPWRADSADVVVAAPGLHATALDALGTA
ncbi:inositol monophosphatase family protein [Amycolatopsis sp., V23-08]|uniref:Inositol monophosphatase family protein n=1 Tax=Amycolatopsis heterodermiae TaxID=3110235 RepID=A0ABU5RM09_9PSEU|nr:inositol monophosphatase family protein [Amycolatopsis sp., V23-08]MEA5367336.1 inositol monophosphatase family protein [Amycolatopsis sp., V23-08]